MTERFYEVTTRADVTYRRFLPDTFIHSKDSGYTVVLEFISFAVKPGHLRKTLYLLTPATLSQEAL
jgi:hypothetical protein